MEAREIPAVFLAVTMCCILSGFPLWLEWFESSAWPAVHNITGLPSIVFALSHVWRNRQRLVGLVRLRAVAPTR